MRKMSPNLGSLATQERHKHEEHGRGAHQRLEPKGRALTGGGHAMHQGGRRKRTPVMRPGAYEVQGHGDELSMRNQ
jgi:hypothetical protein